MLWTKKRKNKTKSFCLARCWKSVGFPRRTNHSPAVRQHMLKLIPILTFLFLTLISSGQNCKYAEYYHLTDLAKSDCKKENFKDARSNFKLAFAETVFPLGHDLSYALYTANKLKDDQWARQIAENLAKGGIPLRYFVKFKKKKWYNGFASNFLDYEEYFKKHFNVEMRNRFLIISKNDSQFTDKYHEWRERKIELTLQELIDGATNVLMDFKGFNEKFGFPSELKMGYNYVRRKNNIEPYPINVLMIHIYQMGTLLYKDNIHTLVCQGALHTNFEMTLKKIQGFGDSTGVEQEMKARYKKYRETE